jgi:hypothetical protein
MMPNQERSTATPPVLDGPQWRALLEARWQARLTELTERALAYHALIPEARYCPRCDAKPGGPW